MMGEEMLYCPGPIPADSLAVGFLDDSEPKGA